MKYFFLAFPLFLYFNISVNAQNYQVDSSYNKWLHSIINIESHFINTKAVQENDKKFDSNKIDYPTFIKNDRQIQNNALKVSGTAVFLEYNNQYFIITARHMLNNPELMGTNLAEKLILIDNDSAYNSPIVKVDSFGNAFVTFDPTGQIFINDLNIGGSNHHRYILSSIPDDLGILNLSAEGGMGEFFLKKLFSRNYKPLKISDIDTNFKPIDNSPIFTIGYPENSWIGIKPLPQNYLWESKIVSVPVISLGVYTNRLPKNSNFFDAAMFSFHGFSGGPVFCNNKLIGIVSGAFSELYLTGQKAPFQGFFLNHPKFIKSSLILPLLKTLVSRR